MKTKYKAAKTELKRNPSRKLETENRWLEKKVEKCRTDLQRRRSYFENEKSKLEDQLEASKARIAELENERECLVSEQSKLHGILEKMENDLEDQKLAFEKLKSEHETSSDQSTIHELKIKLRNSKWQILQLQSENQNCEDCKDLQNEQNKLEKELENHKLELNKLKSEHEVFSSQQPNRGETSCQSCKNTLLKNRPKESTEKVISKQSKLSRSQSVRLVKERHNSLADYKSSVIANIFQTFFSSSVDYHHRCVRSNRQWQTMAGKEFVRTVSSSGKNQQTTGL